jgi:hypothetical protein
VAGTARFTVAVCGRCRKIVTVVRSGDAVTTIAQSAVDHEALGRTLVELDALPDDAGWVGPRHAKRCGG